MKETLADLFHTVEALRAEKFPDLPEELVARIIDVESENLDAGVGALEAVERIVEEYANKEVA